ncbi:MAG: hypothetical protein KJS95_11245 [Gammaproteobacteria bacterium]|nr:hypothetical protein [Gammaproteobacteria bacterium]
MSKPMPAVRMLQETAGTLRSKIQLRVELARDLHPDSLSYLLAHQRIAVLEHQLAALEGGR